MKFDLVSYLNDAPFFVIAGPCVLESLQESLFIGSSVKEICGRLSLPAFFKGSFDKANRTSLSSFRGVGLEKGLEILKKVGEETKLPLLTDIHLPMQAKPASEICQILQIPAFLSRQTDLICSAAESRAVVNIKKGQFLSPWETKSAVEKVRGTNREALVILTERGTSFGYGNLVVDMRGFKIMKEWADFVVFDATHSLQLPGAGEGCTLGQREFIPHLARSAMASGCVDGVFFEVHPEPERSPSDSGNILNLNELEGILRQLISIKAAIK